MLFARVIIDLSLDRIFDYRIPGELEKEIRVGSRVRIPFGSATKSGYVLDVAASSNYDGEIRTLLGLEKAGHLPESLIKLGLWMSDYYCCSREQAVRTLLPGAVRRGIVRAKTLVAYRVAEPRTAKAFIENNRDKKSVAPQIKVLEYLLPLKDPLPVDLLLNRTDATISTIRTLKRKELIVGEEVVVRRNPFGDSVVFPSVPPELNPAQKKALEQIKMMLAAKDSRHVLLLYGVTNSGKTEVYLQAIAEAVQRGKSAIVLVPEIALTPQTVRRFRARFGDEISVMHSRLTDGERFDEWMRIDRGEVQIVVGARSALFAPLRNLGLIIVDEEHESTYKQSESPRYHARDVAVMRGKFENATVILGSATPSFESFANARSGKYAFAELPQRADGGKKAKISIVDMRIDAPQEGEKKSNLFSKTLIAAIRDRLVAGEQSILFLNRRGFARQMMCENCGYVAMCSECSIAYTYHRQQEILSCHLCGGTISAPSRCPSCGAPEIRYSGSGTEKVEQISAKLFPGARIVRMDSDSMRFAGAHEDTLDRFLRGEIDILIGTQMIAKGLHFPNVTLVGVVNADQGLYIPDFRAAERTFQLLTQVAGRSGRGEIPGEVIIQSFNPYNDVITMALEGDYDSFYEYDMAIRTQLHYPPDGHLMVLHFRSEDPAAARAYSEVCMEQLRPYCHDGIIVTGPEPSPVERIKNHYRYQIIFRGSGLKALRYAIRSLILHTQAPKGVELYADVDAQLLM